MKELIIFSLVVPFVAAPIAILAIRLIFKKSYLTKIGITIVAVVLCCVLLAFLVAKIGIVHLSWGVPVCIFVIVSGIALLRKDIQVLQKLEMDLVKVSNLDIDIGFNAKHTARHDEIGSIAKSIEKMTGQLNRIVSKIQGSSHNLANLSSELSSASEQLSQGANEQAATTEEIASSMEEMFAAISSNTEKAELTGNISTKSAEEMKLSNDTFIKTINYISEISKKTSVISDISFQTNILSINASIEAARAGAFGKGFSVVAQEVRALSEKAEQASNAINELSISGQRISSIAGEKLAGLLPEISRSSELIANIVSASKEQQGGVEMINKSVQQLTEITNQNSSSAEEMALSASGLSNQAQQLSDLVSGFKIKSLHKEQIIAAE